MRYGLPTQLECKMGIIMGTTTSLMTFEDFERLPEEPGKRELLKGELIELQPAKKKAR